MNAPRILIVEDSLRDLDLIVREFRVSGYDIAFERVETAQEMSAALAAAPWDVIISDNTLPTFNATEALEVRQKSGLDIPFIIVSGMIGETRAVELMKAGASDYVSKQNLSRLPLVIERELREAAERRERHRIEAELARVNAERELMMSQRSALLDINNAVIANLDRGSLCQAIFEAVCGQLPCNSALLLLREPQSANLDTIVSANTRVSEAISGHQAALQRLGNMVISTGRVLTAQLGADEAFLGEQLMTSAGIRSYIAAPLVTKASPFGVLVLSSASARLPDREDMEFFARVSLQVSFAVENTLAYEEIASLKARLESENACLIEEIKSEHNFEEMVGNSPAFRVLTETIRRVAPTDATVLITGESGTGKELAARALHSLSSRRHKPLVKVNCAAISPSLVESELFGHRSRSLYRCSQTGALADLSLLRAVRFFSTEAGELPLDIQAKLLRVLQEHEFEPVGSNRTIQVDVRIIAATNRRLEDAVSEGRFRADLYFRLNVLPIVMPPLRERRGDIPDLVSSILGNYNRQFGRKIESVTDETMRRLTDYDWPGNIRELQNLLARSVVLSAGSVLKLGAEFFPSSQVNGTRHR